MENDYKHSDSSADWLGYRLDLMDEAERLAFEARIPDAARREAIGRRIDALLTPLAADDVQVPRDLVSRVLARVEDSRSVIPFPRLEPVRPAEAHAPQKHYLFSLRELSGLAAAIAIFVGLFLPGYQTARRNAQQAVCADHLRQIGYGSAAYGQSFGLPWPVVSAPAPGASWAFAGAEPPGYRNGQNLYRLVSGGFVPPSAVNCPGRAGDLPLASASLAGVSDFPDPRNNSYSTCFVPSPSAARSFRPDTPVGADLTPLVDQNRRLVEPARMSMNSDSHGPARGQNVLYLDASVKFQITPHAGIDNDDIYRVIGVQRYTGHERPSQRSDAFLIP